MKYVSFIFFLSLGICLKTFSADNFKQTIRGTVTDAVTGYPLIGATVVLLESNPVTGTTTDFNGNFVIHNIEVGRRSLEVSYVGYKARSINNLLLTSAKEVVLQIELEENAVVVEEVAVKATRNKEQAQNEMAVVSARTFSVEETERFAGSLGDPARMVANYAGVMTQNDSRNDIIIRGNSPMGVLWRMEGVEIPNPNHFGALGTTGGPVSMVNNNLLANSDFLTGAFPAEYGNATAGAFDLNLRSGNNQVREFTGQVGFNGFELGAEGPLTSSASGQKASYLANFRYSTLEVFDVLGFNFGTGAAIPQYKDLTFLVDVPGTKFGRFKVFGLLGNSYIELGRELQDTTANSYNPVGSAINYGSQLGVIGVSHTYFINDKMRFKTSLSYQSTTATADVDSTNLRENIFKPYYRSVQTENKLSFATQFRHKINAKNNYSFGVIADWFAIDYADSVFQDKYGKFIDIANIEGTLDLFRAYGQWQHRFSEAFTAYSGLHFQYFGLNNELAVEPRLSLRWQVSPKSSFDAGFGMHSQIQPKATYYYESYDNASNSYSITNNDVKFTRSNHYVLGYNYLIMPGFRLKAETYYQYLYNIPVAESDPQFSMVNSGADFNVPLLENLENNGTGENYGLEFTAEKFLNRGFYFLFTASLFESKYKGYDKIERNTAFNGNYVFNLLAGYEHKVGKNSMITFDIKTVWAGGKRYVPVDTAQSRIRGEEVRDWGRAFDNRYGDYFRTDLRIGFKLNGQRISQEWGLDLQNITGYQSIFMEGYDVSKNEVYKTYQQGFMPMMLYRINF
ncbi:MAG: TonB-dependent receptor [Prolixibacteraceae bacterium]|nr:TonB-dependent receptor [Prolixibacteraceae bacterium]